jgi:hypothetical protein
MYFGIGERYSGIADRCSQIAERYAEEGINVSK